MVVVRLPGRDQGQRRATGGLLSIIEITEPPDAAGPMHVHHREGRELLDPRGERHHRGRRHTIEASAGDFAFGPREQARTLSPASDEEPDWDFVAAIAKAKGCELLAYQEARRRAAEPQYSTDGIQQPASGSRYSPRAITFIGLTTRSPWARHQRSSPVWRVGSSICTGAPVAAA